MSTVYLGLGSNLGDRKQNLTEAIKLLSNKVKMGKLSFVYGTEPVGYKDQPRFLNMVCEISTSLPPEELLEFVKDIERRIGRKESFPNAPRPIDIDILFYNSLVFHSRDLNVPHPRAAERAFVLVPMSDIAPDLVHPDKGKTIAELLVKLGSPPGIRNIGKLHEFTKEE